jgi:hypothetical protein
MHRSIRWTFLALFLATVGCAHGRSRLSTTDDRLRLEGVVLYRNGVGYFERSGEVDGDTMTIRVRKDQVNDLLKSLTIVDRREGQALSVSMPLDPQSWANAALATLAPGQGSLAEVLDALRGTDVVLSTVEGRIRGRIVMVEEIVNEPDPTTRERMFQSAGRPAPPSNRDHKITLLHQDELRVIRLSKVVGITLRDGDLAMQLHRSLDATAGEGMFQQVEVRIRLAGAKKHDLSVSYVVAAPMWKPTYRVVLPETGKGKALLQGWAVVDNTSGEDWTDVSLALTSGAPIAFAYDLHTPRDVERADLTERGVRRRARAAVGESSFAFDDEAEGEEALAEAEEMAREAERMLEDADAIAQPKADAKKRKSRPRRAGLGGRGAPAAAPAPSSELSKEMLEAEPTVGATGVDPEALRRSTLAQARASQISGLSRFDLEDPVTVPDGSSTMVAIINHDVEAEETFLYRPGGAGIGYDANPYRVVRFTNGTKFVLEPGPISIYAGGSFVGEGLSEAVGSNRSATIPFAVEPGILISSKVEHAGDEMRLLRIARGVLEVETFARKTTTWTAKGQVAQADYSVLIRHPKAGWNYELKDRPPGTEDLPDAYLVPLPIAKGKREGDVKVVEQTPSKTTISIWDTRALPLLETLLLSTNLGPDARKRLEPIVKLRQEIGRIDTQVDGLKRQQVELDQRSHQTRQNLEAIKKDPAASKLRRRLSKRLDEFTRQGDRIGREIVELQSQRLENKIELEDLLQDLDLRTPAEKKPKRDRPRG